MRMTDVIDRTARRCQSDIERNGGCWCRKYSREVKP